MSIFRTNKEHSKNTPLIIRASIVSNNKMFKNIAENAKDCKTILGKIVIPGMKLAMN
jgi:hypothetical protein